MLAIVSSAQGAVTLSLSTAADLSNLNVGDVVTFDVTLSGLLAAEELEYLQAKIVFDSPPLGTATTPTAGTVVPLLGAAYFTSSGVAGSADAQYDAEFFNPAPAGPNITTNGVFFCFLLPC